MVKEYDQGILCDTVDVNAQLVMAVAFDSIYNDKIQLIKE